MVPPVVIQLTRDSDTSIDDESCETIARALGKQLARDVAPIHGLVPAVEYVPPGGALEDAACIARIQRVSDTPGAAAYHDLDSKGRAFVRAFEDSTNGWLAPSTIALMNDLPSQPGQLGFRTLPYPPPRGRSSK